MELLTAIKNRRSTRNFSDKKVERNVIEKIIEAGTQAPSSCNIQGWRFVVLDDQKIKGKISEAGGSILIKKSPAGIMVLYDNRTKNFEYQDHIQSASAAIENMLLFATELGIGCCWINHLPSKRVLRKILNIPNIYSPIAYILLGYPLSGKELLPIPRKYKIDQLVSYNNFGKNIIIEKTSETKIFFQKIFIKIYYLTPLFIKKTFLNKFLDKKFVKKFEN